MSKPSTATLEDFANLVRQGYTPLELLEITELGIPSMDRYLRWCREDNLLPRNITITGNRFTTGEVPAYPREVDKPIPLDGFDTQDMLEHLSTLGYLIVPPERQTDRLVQIRLQPWSHDWYAFGVVSDTHMGSRFQQLTHLHSAYDLFAEEGINTVLHAGDISDGQHVYRGHEYELFVHGATAQSKYIAKRYPHREGITTHFIAGNHDDDHWKRAGVDIGEMIALRRDDLVYEGLYGAKVSINGCLDVYLHHPDGGVAYARSYKPQKMVEQFAPGEKPRMLIQGHYHTGCTLPMYRNVFAMMVACFQAQTPYLKRKGLYPEVGFNIVQFVPDGEGGVQRIRQEFMPFFVPKEDDY